MLQHKLIPFGVRFRRKPSIRRLFRPLRLLLAGIAIRWHLLKIDIVDCFRVKASPRKGGMHGFKVGAAVVGSHLAIMELEPRVMLAADFGVIDYAVYDFGDVQVRDLGINNHVPVLVGDMWDSVDQRQVGRVLMGDGNGGFDMMEVGSLGDGDTALRAISENGMFVGGFSDSPTSVSIGQGFVARLADLENLTPIEYANQGPNSFLSNPVYAVTDTAGAYGDAEGARLVFVATADGQSQGLPGDYLTGEARDAVNTGGLAVGFAHVGTD